MPKDHVKIGGGLGKAIADSGKAVEDRAFVLIVAVNSDNDSAGLND